MSIVETLCAIQSELRAPKTRHNEFVGNTYRNAEDILEAVKPILAKHKAVIILTDEVLRIGERYYIAAVATLKTDEDSISVSACAREEETKKGMDAAQITGAASSYARKYALSGLLAIDDNKDPDATNNGDQPKKPEPKKPEPKKPEPKKPEPKKPEPIKDEIKRTCAAITAINGKSEKEQKLAAMNALGFAADKLGDKELAEILNYLKIEYEIAKTEGAEK